MSAKFGVPTCIDAVIVLPGIMGSELVDRDGTVQWGLRPSLLATAWLTGRLDSLVVTDEDLASTRVDGRLRLEPTRLLRVPGYTPFLGGLEPYTRLLERVKASAVDPRAVAEFPYDWRLSTSYNAERLVRRCEEHIDAWRKIAATERYCDPGDIRLMLVAHSMGGLIARIAAASPGMSDVLREIVTLGTPFYGAVKAVQILTTGDGTPLPKRAARRIARTCPGVYDLLPKYRCVYDPSAGPSGRYLSVADVSAIGGNRYLADDAATRWSALNAPNSPSESIVAQTKSVAGIGQPTSQSVTIDAGAAEFHTALGVVDFGGDSTVYRRSSTPPGVPAFPIPQKHGALAKCNEALTFVIDKLTGGDTGPPTPTRELGAHIPDVIEAGCPAIVRVTGADGDPVGIRVSSIDIETGARTIWTDVTREDATLVYVRDQFRPGLHRVEVEGGGYSAVTDILLVMEAL